MLRIFQTTDVKNSLIPQCVINQEPSLVENCSGVPLRVLNVLKSALLMCTLKHGAAVWASEPCAKVLLRSDYSTGHCSPSGSAPESLGDPTLMTRSVVTGAWGNAGKKWEGGVGEP